MKTKKLNNIFAMFFVVMIVALVGCSKYELDGYDTPEPPKPDPDPTTLVRVEKVNCTIQQNLWDGENVTLATRSNEYDAMYRDGKFWVVTTLDYNAKLTYSDSTTINKTKSFDVTTNVNAFWGTRPGYIKDINSLNSKPEISVRSIENGELNSISWKGIWNVALVVSSSKSTNSLDFEGKTVTDLCTPEMTLTYQKVIITDLQRDSARFHLYEVAVVLDAKLDGGKDDYRQITLGAKKFWMPTDGGDIPDPDTEIVLYELRKQGFDYKTELTSRSYATLVALYTTGAEKEVKTIETTVNNYSKFPEKQEYIVPNFDYIESEPRIFKMVADGSERVSTENADISLKGYQTTYITGTNYFSCTFEGHYEIPYYTDPLGKKHTMLYKEYGMANLGVVRGSVKTEGNFQILPLTSKVDATFNERLYNLSAEVDLKNPNGSIEENLTGLRVENVRVINEFIHYDLIRIFPSGNKSTAMKILHMGKQNSEDRKSTKERNYDFTSSKTDTLSKTDFVDGKHTGRLVKFTKTYHYNDFDNVITNEVRTNIVYTEGGFSALIFAGNAICDKVGVSLGTTDLGNERQHIYDDNINYQLNIGSVKAAGSTQVVRYTEEIPVPEKKLISVEEHQVINETDHVIKITFDDGTFEYDNITVAKPVSLIGGVINDLNRDNVNFGTGNVDHNQTPASGTISTNGRVTATPYTHTYSVTYNNHRHNVTGTYCKYKYTYAYKGVEKSCDLTSPTLQVENTSVDLGTSRKDTIDLKIYETTPVTFMYNGTYGTQTTYANVKTNNVNYIGDVVVKTSFVFAGMARILNPTEKGFYNGVILNVSGEKNGYRVIIPQIGYDKFYDNSTVLNSGKIEAAVWNGIDYLPCEVLVDNAQQLFAYDAKNTAGDKKLPMTFAEALIAGIKNYSGNINTTVTPVIAGATAVKSNGKTIVSLGGAVVLIVDDEIENSSRSSRR